MKFHFQTFSRVFFFALLVGVMALSGRSSHAASPDEASLIEGAKLCTRYVPRHERQYGIPEHLLAAIASTESGRFHRGLGLNLPWPWTINVNGRGYFFDTKEEAVAAVNKLRADGVQSIDVGCMQVNLRHHPTAFASVEQAFDPAYNVGYAASFLKRNFMEEGSWRKATGDYHSRTPSFGGGYSERVFGTWGRIVAKVADARAGRPVLNNYAKNSTFKKSDKPVVMASRSVRPSYRSPRMNMVSVTSRNKVATRENGVLVIRPQKNDEIVVDIPKQESALLAKPKAVQVATRPTTPEDRELVRTVTTGELVSKPSSGVQFVKVNDKTKGQFQPRSHANASLDSLSLSRSATPKAGNKLFVFDN